MTYFVDHVESALKHSIKDLRDLTSDVSPQLVDDGRHGAEDLGLSGGGDVALVVNQDRIEKRWHEVLPYLEWHQKYYSFFAQLSLNSTASPHVRQMKTSVLFNVYWCSAYYKLFKTSVY